MTMKAITKATTKATTKETTMERNYEDNYIILFHGNCIDGWFSAYIAYTCMRDKAFAMYPISHSQPNTWPNIKQMRGHILLLDVSVPMDVREKWMKGGALSINCIDHHESSVADWPAGTIDTTSCAALQTFKHFYPQLPVPQWLHVIDRIDRWDRIQYEDRCIREMLNLIAHKPVQQKVEEALKETEEFIQMMSTPQTAMIYIQSGANILMQKDMGLTGILEKGKFHLFTEEYIAKWKLPATWLNKYVYIIDNTGITFDSTEAAHLIFQSYPSTNIFINYRKREFKVGGVQKTSYVYSARSMGVDLTEGTIFRGHPCAAGATIMKDEVEMIPFHIA